MVNHPMLAAAVGAAAAVVSGTAGAAPAVARTEAHFEVVVAAPLARAFPLFGAWGERAWAGDDWQPRFLHPTPPRDEAYAVFTVAHGSDEAVWVNTAFDLASGRIQYVYVVPGVQAVVIELALAEAAGRTRVAVTYRRTALDPAMNDRVRAAGDRDRQAGPSWQAQLDAALSDAAARPAAGRR